jgi:hypothetical protein
LSRRHTRVLLAVLVFLAAWGMLHFWFYARDASGDVPLYQSYGDAMRHGQVPYRDFPVEYPPGALPAFVLPALPGGTFATWFDWLMAACGAGCVALTAAFRSPRIALPFAAVSPVLVGSLERSHFDLWPTLLALAALVALLRERHVLGWALLGASFAAKLFAVVLVPLAIVWTLRRRGPRTLATAIAVWIAVVVVVCLPFAILAPHELRTTVTGQVTRPLQIETLAGSYLMTFEHPTIESSHGSKSLPNHGGLAAVTSAVMLAVLVGLWVGFARGAADGERLVRYTAACICTFVALGKILSPQYLVWIVPFVPLVRGRRGLAATALLVAVLVNTQVWFPSRYFTEYVYTAHLAWLVLIRNILLVGLVAVLALPTSRGASRTASAR